MIFVICFADTNVHVFSSVHRNKIKMSEETGVDARKMMAGVEQMEEGKIESLEGGGSPEKLITDEKIQEREQEINGVGSSPVREFSIIKLAVRVVGKTK